MPTLAEFSEYLEREAAAAAARRAAKPSKDAKAKFRSSIAWRRLRFAVLAENAAKNGGTARCELCGAKGEPDAPLHVDHIEAASKNWSRRLDRTNMQVLCPDCNVGKLDGPAADFRSKADE